MLLNGKRRDKLKEINGIMKSDAERMASLNKCPSLVLEDGEDGVAYALCSVRDMYVVKSKVSRCVEIWNGCPFYPLSVKMNGK